jgi:hypothetical protein
MNIDYQSMEILVSSDFGKTWPTRSVVPIVTYPMPKDTPPQIVRMNRPWLHFGPKGMIGVVWRQDYRPGTNSDIVLTRVPNNGPEDIYAAVSFDAGVTFSAPVKANSVPSGWEPSSVDVGDDYSAILVESDVVHVGWGAYRPERTTYYAQIPLAAFRTTAVRTKK